MNLAANLARSAERYPDHPAVRLDDTVVCYADLDRRSVRAAGFLREHGVRPGDRVAIMLANVPEFAVAYYGILRAGGVVVPINPLLKEREVAYYLDDSGARLIFAGPACAEPAAVGASRTGAVCVVVDAALAERWAEASPIPADGAGMVDRADGDTAVILYTSGTTGQPKGAELTHANLLSNVDIVATDLIQVGPEDVIFGGLPLFHSFGQTCGLNTAVSVGACVTLVARFDAAKVLSVLERDRVTVFEGVPTMYLALLAASDYDRYDVSALRVCVSGGAALPVEVLHRFEKAFGCTILDHQTEVLGFDCSWVAADLSARVSADPDQITILVAEAGERFACTAFAVYHPGTDFVALLGGATLPDWRGRGLYRAMIAARARDAVARGFRLLHVDASPASAPILRRCGFHEITTSTHYQWTPSK